MEPLIAFLIMTIFVFAHCQENEKEQLKKIKKTKIIKRRKKIKETKAQRKIRLKKARNKRRKALREYYRNAADRLLIPC